MTLKNYPRSRKDNLVVQEMDGEVLVYDLADNRAFCLNETSGLIWQTCDGEKSITEISELISKQLNSPANEDLVWLALDQLKKENLIENEVVMPSDLEGLSRREIIKKIGLGTMIAIPLVSSLVAPTAVLAQSTACSTSGRGSDYNDNCTCSYPACPTLPPTSYSCASPACTNSSPASCVCRGPWSCPDGMTAAGMCS